jgi:hypothetical protein
MSALINFCAVFGATGYLLGLFHRVELERRVRDLENNRG